MKTALLSLTFLVISAYSNSQMTLGVNNLFRPSKFTGLHQVNANGTHNPTVRTISNSKNMLRGYATKVSDDRDSMYIEFWKITGLGHQNDPTIINIADSNKTFAYKIDWHNGHFKLPFRARALTAVSIPFRVKMRNKADLEAEFLNIGITHVWLWGHTKFYKSKHVESRQFYYGVGPFLAFSQLKIDSTNTRGYMTTEKQVANFSYGVNGLISVNNFHFVLALGFDNTFGPNAKHYQDNISNRGASPWIGFGVGFKLVDLTVKSENSKN
jgi:hypothetical protein